MQHNYTKSINELEKPSTEYIIIWNALSKIKANYLQINDYLNSKKTDKFFDILNTVLLFYDKFIQAKNYLDNSLQCKTQILDNLISINREICEEKVSSFLDMVNYNQNFLIESNYNFYFKGLPHDKNFDTFNIKGESFITDESLLKNANILDRLKNKIKNRTEKLMMLNKTHDSNLNITKSLPKNITENMLQINRMKDNLAIDSDDTDRIYNCGYNKDKYNSQ